MTTPRSCWWEFGWGIEEESCSRCWIVRTYKAIVTRSEVKMPTRMTSFIFVCGVGEVCLGLHVGDGAAGVRKSLFAVPRKDCRGEKKIWRPPTCGNQQHAPGMDGQDPPQWCCGWWIEDPHHRAWSPERSSIWSKGETRKNYHGWSFSLISWPP